MKQNKNESKGIYAFANKIYELRNEKQMDYFELSRITGINDVEYLSKLESASIINPSAGKIIRIGQALEADIFELLSLAKNREENEGIQLRIEVDNRTISFILNRTVCKQSLNL
ncbi:helix-turn-helix transcriptional regulator [Geobacillus sp. E263]|uniref:helix-turn-helix domain-containing protein n=1 Tax=Geobacillus sp. E263 TaxID=391290 RepID=UPI00117B36D2|nr:helix-turn-helix transcriptional regulator [Geobacillus sp. E263]